MQSYCPQGLNMQDKNESNHNFSYIYKKNVMLIQILDTKKITVVYRIHPQYNTAADSFPTKFHSFPQITHLQFNHQTCIYLPATAKGTTTYSCCWVGSLNRTLFPRYVSKDSQQGDTYNGVPQSLERRSQYVFRINVFFRNGFFHPLLCDTHEGFSTV